MIALTKSLAKRALCWCAVRLPWGARDALANCLAEKGGYSFLQRIAPKYGISGFVANGKYGMVQGELNDESIFPYYAAKKVWAHRINEVFIDLLKEGGTYLDIGANIGLTTLPVAQNPKVLVSAFEPNPNIFRLLSANVHQNCTHGNVTLYNVALFDEDSTVTMELSPTNSGDHRVRKTNANGDYGETHWPTLRVPAKRLDDFQLQIIEPIAVKIDTQGAEPFVLRGGQSVLSRATLLAIEFWPYSIRRMGGDPEEVIDFLSSNFQQGAVSEGDIDRFDAWQPMEDLAIRLRDFSLCQSHGLKYLDVLAAKSVTPILDK